MPRTFVGAIARRYIAGASVADALDVARSLNAIGKLATIDVLGEEITNEADTRTVSETYRDVLTGIQEKRLDANVSVKPTAFGLGLSYELCLEHLRAVVSEAAASRNFVRIDMEDSSRTRDTLRLYRALREEGYDNLGVVLQARLRQTLRDVVEIADLRPNVRLCKGIYVEPRTLAHSHPQSIRDSFVHGLNLLLDSGCYVAIATHDEWLIAESLQLVSRYGLSTNEYELQMLLGVREERADELVAAGHRLRVYLPFGDQWYEYSLRRLQENPAIAGHVARATAARVFQRCKTSTMRSPSGGRFG